MEDRLGRQLHLHTLRIQITYECVRLMLFFQRTYGILSLVPKHLLLPQQYLYIFISSLNIMLKIKEFLYKVISKCSTAKYT